MNDRLTGRLRVPAIAVCGVDFGWGSAGKLAAILAATAQHGGLRTIVLGTQLGRPVLAGARVDAWYEKWPRSPAALRSLLRRHGVAAGLVVLDPSAAERLEDVGVPTVYVDSIPYIWTRADPVPTQVTAYCAQRGADLPEESRAALAPVARLMWIDAILPERRGRMTAGARTAVLNFGGLHSPTNMSGNPHYLALVAAPSIRALADAGYRHIEVCGNVSAAELAASAVADGVSMRIGSRTHEDFTAILSAADLLLTSPGLTTLLEASTVGTPTLCLPPQNLSQVFNGQRFASAFGNECLIAWPRNTLDLNRLAKVRRRGEDVALRFINDCLAARHPIDIHVMLYEKISQGINFAVDPAREWGALADHSGRHGAWQVAALLCQLVTSGKIPAGSEIDENRGYQCAAHAAPERAEDGS
jgi:hydroxymethylcytosylglucuronate/cytosylglucuronate synthase